MALDSDRLAAFVAVAEERGFSRAAVRLGKTQSAVSQAVSRLEEEVGQALFIREARTTRLSQAGTILLEHARVAFSELDRATRRLASLASLDEGELSIGTSDTFACYLLPRVLARYRLLHPRVELRLDNRPSPAIVHEVAARRVEVGIVSLPLPPEAAPERPRSDEAVTIHALAPLADVAIVAPGHPLAKRTRTSLHALARSPLLLLDESTATRGFLNEAFSRASVSPRVLMEMSSVEVLKRLVELDFGVSIVPAMAVDGETARGSLHALGIRGLRARERRVGMVVAAAPLSHAASAFADLVRSMLA